MLNIPKIHHVAIICSNYENSKRFYTEVLGFGIIKETFRKERDSYKLDLRVGEHSQIELFSFPNPPKRLSNPEACGLRHLAFEVSNLEEIHEAIKAAGVPTEDIRFDEITEKNFFFFRDPDDLPLEIYAAST